MSFAKGDRVRLVGEVAAHAATMRRFVSVAVDSGITTPHAPGERGTVEEVDVTAPQLNTVRRVVVRWDNGRTDFVAPIHLEQLDPIEWLGELA